MLSRRTSLDLVGSQLQHARAAAASYAACPAHHVVYKWDDAVAGCRRADGYPATPPQHDDEEAT